MWVNEKVSTYKPSKDRCEDLFKLSKQLRKKEEKRDKDSDEYQIEKEADEYTFHPNTKKPSSQWENVHYRHGGVEENINRLKTAHQQNVKKKQMLQRGEVVKETEPNFYFSNHNQAKKSVHKEHRKGKSNGKLENETTKQTLSSSSAQKIRDTYVQ